MNFIKLYGRGVPPMTHRPYAARLAMNVAQHKIVNLLKNKKSIMRFVCVCDYVLQCM